MRITLLYLVDFSTGVLASDHVHTHHFSLCFFLHDLFHYLSLSDKQTETTQFATATLFCL